MTQYEKLSLALLSHIATGIGFHLSDSLSKVEGPRSDLILRWQESLGGVLENVAACTKDDAS